MKILYISSSTDISTEKSHFVELALSLQTLDNQLLVLVSRYSPAKPRDHGLNVVFVPTGRRTLRSYLFAEFLRFFYLPWSLAVFRPDAIYARKETFDFAPPFWARLFRVSYVVEVNGILDEELRMTGYPEWQISVFRCIEAINYRAASRVVCITEGIKRALVERFGVPEDKLTVVPNGANVELFRPLDKGKCRRELGLPEGFFYVGFAGSFAPWQGLDTLIRAAKRVLEAKSSIRFILVGSGAQEAALREMVRQEGLEGQVHFVGEAEHERVPIYMGAFDVCYVSKVGLSSGFSPLKLYEYLACGRPVIAGRAEGITELIEHGRCGFLFEPNDPVELARIIMLGSEDTDGLEQLGLSGRALVEQTYSWQAIAKRIVTVLDEATKA